ncbi:hypothetical protein SprV_0200902800 [Sparganum proliferum]
MGLFGHMRIHESGTDCDLDTPSTSCAPTMPSSTHTPQPSMSNTTGLTTLSTTCTPTMPSPTHTPSPSPSTISSSTIATISETDTGSVGFLFTLSPHIRLTHRPGRSLANPSHRAWRTSTWRTHIHSPHPPPLPLQHPHIYENLRR